MGLWFLRKIDKKFRLIGLKRGETETDTTKREKSVRKVAIVDK